ncbi:MAG TPA: EAL domain-containing protein [Acidimicrobiales bacterium]|nr:EAL domain-containing protein [Acidimicrobiales bacterium]
MAATDWIAHQLVGFLGELTADTAGWPSRRLALQRGAERIAEALDAEAVWVLWHGRVVVHAGFGSAPVPWAQLRSFAAPGTATVDLPAVGPAFALTVPFGDADAARAHALVLARQGAAFDREEVVLVRSLARVLALTLRSVDAVRAERRLRQRSERLAASALLDPLTGLPNRAAFLDALQRVGAGRVGGAVDQVAVLFMDLDGFKLVNDTLGHHAGDELLQAVAARLAAVMRSDALVARLGGDEFAVLVGPPVRPSGAEAVAERVRSAMAEPFEVAGRRVTAATSIGIAVGPRVGQGSAELLADADLAMYRAKAEAVGRHRVFAPWMRDEVVARTELEQALRASISEGGLRCAYQPIVELATGRVTGLEALVRWERPGVGLLPPAVFLPVAVEAGVIGLLDNWVLGEACRQLAAWRARFPAAADVNLGVNVSGHQLPWRDLPAMVERATTVHGVPRRRLLLEVSEEAVTGADDDATAALAELRRAGTLLAIDDFGTGYSSLRRVLDLPIDVLKIDRGFVAGLHRDTRLRAVTTTICRLGNDLGVDVVAEGVEVQGERDALAAVGCTYGQGYFWARPLDAAQVEQLFEEAGASPVHLGPVAALPPVPVA